MFWGLIMEPGKKYTQTVETSFHIAQAALDLDSAQNSPVQVLIGIDGRNYLVCTLMKDKVLQVPLDLNFQAGNKVSFATNGPGLVHLTGYLVPEDDELLDYGSDEEVEEEEEDMTSKKRKAGGKKDKPNKKSRTEMLLDQLDEEEYNESDDSNVNLSDLVNQDDDDEEESDDEESGEEEEESDDDDDEDDSDEDEVSDEEETVQQKKKSKKQQQQQQESPKQNGIAKKTPKQEKQQKGEKTPKNEQSPKGQKSPGQDKSPKNNQQKQKGAKTPGGESNTPQKKTLEGGVHIEDLKVGEGQIAKPGRNVRVYYEGRLKSNNKLFDSATKGAGFKFRLGKQEVIKGWDVGVAGMKIGGKRRIICPPHMAYGTAGSPPVIPPNSTLVFDVELKQVN